MTKCLVCVFVVCAVLVSCAAGAAEMICVRSLYQGHIDAANSSDPVERADYIEATIPADGYLIAHSGLWEPTIAVLAERGHKIVRYINPMHVRSSLINMPRPSFERAYAELAYDGHVLKDPDTGQPFEYFAFSNPWIITWDTVDLDTIDDMVTRYAWLYPADLWFIDLVYHSLRAWMIDGQPITQAELDQIYDKLAYTTNRDIYLAAFVANLSGPSGVRPYAYNGDVSYYRALGHPIVMERANRRPEFDAWLADWQSCANCLFNLRTPSPTDDQIAWVRIFETVNAWKVSGGWLWADGAEGMNPSNLATWLCEQSALWGD